MNGNLWQFSLRSLFVVTAIVAAVTAFVANYPIVALLIVFAMFYVLLESGAVFIFSEPKMHRRFPRLAAVVWLFVGFVSVVFSGRLFWLQFTTLDAYSRVLSLFYALLFVGLGFYCIWLFWKSVRKPLDPDLPNSTDDGQIS